MKSKIIFNNGFEIEVEVNGTSYIVDDKPNFPADLSNVKIITDDEETVIKNAVIGECASVDDRYWFYIYSKDSNLIEDMLADMENALCEMSMEYANEIADLENALCELSESEV